MDVVSPNSPHRQVKDFLPFSFFPIYLSCVLNPSRSCLHSLKRPDPPDCDSLNSAVPTCLAHSKLSAPVPSAPDSSGIREILLCPWDDSLSCSYRHCTVRGIILLLLTTENKSSSSGKAVSGCTFEPQASWRGQPSNWEVRAGSLGSA